MMFMDEALGLAAQAWCSPKNKDKPMDVNIAEEFAYILMTEVNKREEELNLLLKTPDGHQVP